MKLAACVVLYNPNISVLDNIQTYLPLVEKLYVLDNSTLQIDFLDKIKKVKKVKYVSLNGNKGIAKALKVASELAYQDGFNYLLSMDQDSKYPTEDFCYIENYIKNNDSSDVAQFCINYTGNAIKQDIENVDKSKTMLINAHITSGTITNLTKYFQTEGYDEKLFIDWVDYDLCAKFKAVGGGKIVLFPNICLQHTLGKTEYFKFLFFKIPFRSYPPVRHYYMFRNYVYLLNNRDEESRKFFKSPIMNFWGKLSRIITEKNHIKVWKMINLGIKDAKKGRMGSFEELHPDLFKKL